MKVILLRNVPKVGHKYDVVDVSSGYATNFLFPQKLAEVATPIKEAELAQRREMARVAEDARKSDLLEKLKTLDGTTLTISAKADDRGHLYKKIHIEDIIRAMNEEYNITLPKDSVALENSLSILGQYPINVELFGRKSTISVEVVAA